MQISFAKNLVKCDLQLHSFLMEAVSFCSAFSTQIGQGQLPHDAAISVLVMGDVQVNTGEACRSTHLHCVGAVLPVWAARRRKEMQTNAAQRRTHVSLSCLQWWRNGPKNQQYVCIVYWIYTVTPHDKYISRV